MKLNIQLFAYTKKEWKDLPSKDTPILAADLNNIEKGIGTNTADISTLKTTTSKNTADISTLKTTTSENTADISTLKTTTSKNTTDISNLQTLINNINNIRGNNLYRTIIQVGDIAAKKMTNVSTGLSIGWQIINYYGFYNVTAGSDNTFLCPINFYNIVSNQGIYTLVKNRPTTLEIYSDFYISAGLIIIEYVKGNA